MVSGRKTGDAVCTLRGRREGKNLCTVERAVGTGGFLASVIQIMYQRAGDAQTISGAAGKTK